MAELTTDISTCCTPADQTVCCEPAEKSGVLWHSRKRRQLRMR